MIGAIEAALNSLQYRTVSYGSGSVNAADVVLRKFFDGGFV